MIDSLNNIALSGVWKGLADLQENASQLAGVAAGADENILIAAVVDLKANEVQVAASMKLLGVSSELIGTILDIKA